MKLGFLGNGCCKLGLGLNFRGIISALKYNFESVLGWSVLNATIESVVSGIVGNCAKITNTVGGTVGRAYISFKTIPGKTYNLSLWEKNGTAAGTAYIGTAASDSSIWDAGALNSAVWKQTTHSFTAIGTTTWITLFVLSSTLGHYVHYDELRITLNP